MPVYLDNNATTPLDERVLEAMLPHLGGRYGNPSSLHRHGRLARDAVERARERVAALVGAHPGQVIFTSGGTEANNLALAGTLRRSRGGAVAVSAVEHPSVTLAAAALEREGYRVETLPVDREGRVDPQRLAQVEAHLVSLMWANNETGVLQPVAEVVGALRERGVLVHSDAVQAAGKVAIDFTASGLHLMSLSAHKLNGPQGVGALIADRSVALTPQLYGGGQERGLRPGTENVAAIVGFGMAAELAGAELAQRAQRMRAQRNRLEAGLRTTEGVEIFSAGAERLPNTTMFGIAGIEGETLLMQLDRKGFSVSSGSACGSGKSEPSPVLTAMGTNREVALGAIRVSLGGQNSDTDVDAFLEALGQVTGNLVSRAD